MTQAQRGKTVQVHYTGTLADGSVFDSSQGGSPLEFTIGQGQMIPGFEQGVLGMAQGDSKTITIAATQAYGPHHAERVIKVERGDMPPDISLEVGVQVQGNGPGGRQASFTVVALTESQVTLDGNHPLAGKDLTFEIKLVSVS
ncbi:MAG: peptidylprolyl isomerase [Dehalococcoidia bacterium]|nr:peptidylprolyl isomerase [Dehalococcoidia bacterium]MSQ16394.1 peptidylprolyl isomerase [Dehalococcoidia bacterium]